MCGSQFERKPCQYVSMILPCVLYAGTVITPFNYAITPTRGLASKQTKQRLNRPDHREGTTVTYVCVTNEKDMVLQRQI